MTAVRLSIVLSVVVCTSVYAQSADSACTVRTNTASAVRSDSSSQANAGPVAPTTATNAAVIVLAEAQVGEVTFAKQPQLSVRLCGGIDSVHVLERRNLPNPVVVGRSYRDVYVAVEIFGRVNADCITAALRSTPADSAGRRNACVGLDLTSSSGKRPPEPFRQR
jgi:hypothetical protein